MKILCKGIAFDAQCQMYCAIFRSLRLYWGKIFLALSKNSENLFGFSVLRMSVRIDGINILLMLINDEAKVRIFVDI